MRGLTSVLDRFSEGLRTRKILPSLLEEVRAVVFPRIFRAVVNDVRNQLDEGHTSSTVYTP